MTSRVVHRDPTERDDWRAGYIQGSTWINLETGEIFVCVSNEEGGAAWMPLFSDKKSQKDEKE